MHLLRWAPFQPINEAARGIKSQGGIITLPVSSCPPIRGRERGGVIRTHTVEPSFAIAKVDFPENFDPQPELVLGREENLFPPAPPPIVEGGGYQPNSVIQYGL